MRVLLYKINNLKCNVDGVFINEYHLNYFGDLHDINVNYEIMVTFKIASICHGVSHSSKICPVLVH